MNINYKIKKIWIVEAALFVLFLQLILYAKQDMENREILKQDIYNIVALQSIKHCAPFIVYINGEWKSRNTNEKLWQIFYDDIPVAKYATKATKDTALAKEYLQDYKETEKSVEIVLNNKNEEVSFQEENIQQAVIAENAAASSIFLPVQSPVAMYSREQLRMPGFIKEAFYSEDATTYIGDEQLDYNTLMNFDASLKQDKSNVQVLVYHTHSQETYIDSIPGDKSTSIVGVGEHLCNILRTQYGFNVLHHTGEYDVESRDYAYSNAMVGLEKVLSENPSIEVMIDLHRDETAANTKLVTTIQNKNMAKFMFFNGLCYTRELGYLENLPNPYVQDNLSFAFQLHLMAEEYYPGLTRRIYLKGYRYNLHYRPKSLLVELGAQTNTVEEAMNSCEPLAHIISMVLNGKNKEYQ